MDRTDAPYAYTAGDPVNLFDPLGLIECNPGSAVVAQTGQVSLISINVPIGLETYTPSPRLPTTTAHPWPALNPRNTFIFVPRPSDLFGGESIGGGYGLFPGNEGYSQRPDNLTGILNAEPPILTPWGWIGQGSYGEIVDRVERGGTLTGDDLEGKIPTVEQALQLIEDAGGTVTRKDLEGHPEGGVSTHTYPHINYETAEGRKGTIEVAVSGEAV